jgi:ornithine carbamoyltransferase
VWGTSQHTRRRGRRVAFARRWRGGTARPLRLAQPSPRAAPLADDATGPTATFLAIPDFSRAELDALFALAERMRRGEYTARPLAGRTLAMIFMKSSTRTRVSFEVGTYQLGGHALFLSPRDVQLGRGEPVADTGARALALRGRDHDPHLRARRGRGARAPRDVPVINGLTDLCTPARSSPTCSPCGSTSGTYEGKRVAWIGDGNNMATPGSTPPTGSASTSRSRAPRVRPDAAILARARAPRTSPSCATRARPSRARTSSTPDVWASMGQEEEQRSASARSPATRWTRAHGARARTPIFLHCLPAHRGEEVAAEVIDGPQSRVWDEAENRLHAQKAVLAALMGGESLA